jgi:hypothetical protein
VDAFAWFRTSASAAWAMSRTSWRATVSRWWIPRTAPERRYRLKSPCVKQRGEVRFDHVDLHAPELLYDAILSFCNMDAPATFFVAQKWCQK